MLGRNPTAAPAWGRLGQELTSSTVGLHCCSCQGPKELGGKRGLVQHRQGKSMEIHGNPWKWGAVLWPDIPYTVLSGDTSALGWGGQRTLQQEGNNSFKWDPFKLGFEHPLGSSLASPLKNSVGDDLQWCLSKGIGFAAQEKAGTEHWSLPRATPKSGFVSSESAGLSMGRKVRYKSHYSGPKQVWFGVSFYRCHTQSCRNCW